MFAPSPSSLRALPSLVALLLSAAMSCPAQAPEPAVPDASQPASEVDDVERRVDRAIADYEAALKDKDNHALRRRTLGWLGAIDHPRVSAYLAKDLARHVRYASGGWAIDAIGKVARPKLADKVFTAVTTPKAHASVVQGGVALLVDFGDAQVERLLKHASGKADPSVRAALLRGLAATGSDEVADGLADMMAEGEHAERLFVVRYTTAMRDQQALDRARIRCVKEGNLQLSAAAWRVLAEQEHQRARRLTIDVIERVFDKPDATAAAELVRGLVFVDDRDFYPALLRFGAVRGRNVKLALERSAKRAATSERLLEFLVEEGLESDSAGERMVARTLLMEAPPEALATLVEKVRKQLRRSHKNVLETVSELHELLSKDPTWVQDVLQLASERDLDSRLIGMSMLLEMGAAGAVELAQDYLRNRSWQLRSIAFRYLTKCRDVSSISPLIDRYEREEGRLLHELQQALFVHTGRRCWSRREWSAWWRDNREGFTLPHPDTVKSGGSSSGGQTASYYDIPLVSARIGFIVDQSGSMNAKVGTDRKRTRLDVAKQQLKQVAEALGDDREVNLIPFESKVRPLWDEIRSLSKSRREEFLESVYKLKAKGGTNTYGALIAAYRDPEIDTIYLLTDGQPSDGELTDIDDILDAIAAEQRRRQIVIHCIAVGMDSELLKGLAALTGGEYKYVR